MRILHIDSSISGRQSVSRQLTASIVARLQAAGPAEIHYRDLAADPLPYLGEAALGQRGHGTVANADAATLDAALAEFLAADVVVIGAPMYNFSIASQLKSWIDSISVAGKTFSYSATGVIGLCGGKRIIIACSRGGFYSGESPMAALDHGEPYLEGFFRFVGVTDISFVRAEGINYGPEHRERALASALTEVATLKAS